MKAAPSRNDIDRFARALITLNGETTTLDVKKALRDRGYWVKQDDVRNGLLDITSRDGDITYYDTGVHRVYTFKPISGLTIDDLNDDTANLSHTFQWRPGVGEVCVACGRSEAAIKAFGWAKCVSSTNLKATHVTPSPAAAQVVTQAQKVHRDNIRADYIVTDSQGQQAYTYTNVTRSEAKLLWSKDTGRLYFEARTAKMDD